MKNSEMLEKIQEWKIERDAGTLGYGKVACPNCKGKGKGLLDCSYCEFTGFIWESSIAVSERFYARFPLSEP